MAEPTATLEARSDGVEAIIEAARLGVEPTELELGKVYAAVNADGSIQVIDLATDDHRSAGGELPIRKTGRVAVTEHPSLAKYVNEHAEAGGATLWADREHGRIIAVLNGHQADNAAAGWGDHRATLTLQQTASWVAWTRASGQLVPQTQFAEFLEDQAGDVVTPDHAHLLEVATSIEGAKGAAYKSAVRLDSGEVRFRYEETVEARAGQAGDLTIPTRIELALAPFEGMDPYKVSARFRYRIGGGGELRLGVVLDRPEDVLRAAFADVVEAVEAATFLTVLYGTPAS